MGAMDRFFALLCVVFSQLLAPMAHAVVLDFFDMGSNIADHSSSRKQDSAD